MDLSARTLKLHYSKTLHIFITEFFKNNLHYENRLILCILRSIVSWKLFDTKHLKHKTLLNKVSVYFGVNIYSQQIQNIFLLKIILVNLHSPFNLSLSKQGGDVQTDPQNAVCLKEAKQVLSRHNRQLHLTMLPPNSNIL